MKQSLVARVYAMDVKSMQQAFYRHTLQRYEIVAPNIYLDWKFNEMDIIAIRKSFQGSKNRLSVGFILINQAKDGVNQRQL